MTENTSLQSMVTEGNEVTLGGGDLKGGGSMAPETQTFRGITEDNKTLILYESGDDIYICKAVIGTALTSASWQIRKISTSGDVRIKWCDGDDLYDNVATNAVTVIGLSYS